ncbi:MAG: hypothetical protein JXK08_05515 [Flavobacteriaceae bacterium]|nr:hypothetical protein [Flavobacteriaceae bacterium]HIC30736.1 hypothetical protein [Flavobacteriaceae bacterium]
MNLKKFLVPLILLLLGFGLTIVGALFKIQHWPYGSVILTIGTFVEFAALFYAIIVLIKIYRNKY